MRSDLPSAFDAFGTLVEITDKRQAFVPLFRILASLIDEELMTGFGLEEFDLAKANGRWPSTNSCV